MASVVCLLLHSASSVRRTTVRCKYTIHQMIQIALQLRCAAAQKAASAKLVRTQIDTNSWSGHLEVLRRSIRYPQSMSNDRNSTRALLH